MKDTDSSTANRPNAKTEVNKVAGHLQNKTETKTVQEKTKYRVPQKDTMMDSKHIQDKNETRQITERVKDMGAMKKDKAKETQHDENTTETKDTNALTDIATGNKDVKGITEMQQLKETAKTSKLNQDTILETNMTLGKVNYSQIPKDKTEKVELLNNGRKDKVNDSIRTERGLQGDNELKAEPKESIEAGQSQHGHLGVRKEGCNKNKMELDKITLARHSDGDEIKEVNDTTNDVRIVKLTGSAMQANTTSTTTNSTQDSDKAKQNPNTNNRPQPNEILASILQHSEESHETTNKTTTDDKGQSEKNKLTENTIKASSQTHNTNKMTTTITTRNRDKQTKSERDNYNIEEDEEEEEEDVEAPLAMDNELVRRLLPHMSPDLLPKSMRPQNLPSDHSTKPSTETQDIESEKVKIQLGKLSFLNVIQESSEDDDSSSSGDEAPARPPLSGNINRRHSFHHSPATLPIGNSKKAEKVRAHLQAVEEEELEKISKKLGEKSEHDLVRQHLGHVENRLFEMFGDKEKRTININKFLMGLTATGMRPSDPRLKQTRDNITKMQEKLGNEFVMMDVDYKTFTSIVSENLEIVVRAFSASFVIPDFQGFCRQVEDIYNHCYTNDSGKPAQYIPQLARFDSKNWGVSICTVDGQRFSLGDVEVPFTIQSCSKPLTYAIGLAVNGTDYMHNYVGMEPSGRYFNELVLDYNNKPHNPMINSGAMMTAAIIKPELSAADRFDYMFKVYKRLAGDEYLGFNNSVFLSEKECADRNFALAYFMRENKCFPENHKLQESLEFYFQLCSLEITAESGAVMAATLANGGLNPLTSDPVLTVDAVRNTLTLMHSCGMYNYSGQFAFHVGLPAKSGVSGCVLLVIPNTMGICLWSPPLDSNGNSCRGVQFCMEMVSRFNFHNFDNLRGYSKSKQDPRTAKIESKAQIIFDLLFSAAAGDMSALRRHLLAGSDMQARDYDGRTALHVATSEGHHEIVDFLLNKCHVHPLPKDRWDRTPLDDAENFDRPKCAKLIKDCCHKKCINIPLSYKDLTSHNIQSNGQIEQIRIK